MSIGNGKEGSVARAYRILILFLFLGGLTPAQVTESPKLTAEDRTFVASKVGSLGQAYFFSPINAPAAELDASYKTYLRMALATGDRREFDLATIEFVAQLHNGHTFFWDAWLDQSSQPLRAENCWGRG